MSAACDLATPGQAVSVLCVDDNEQVAAAIRIKLRRTPGFLWSGWLATADTLVDSVRRARPDTVVLDIDLPGRSPFEALEELAGSCPGVRVVMFSGHVSHDLIERAMDAGAWGYVSKNDGEDALILALREVMAGEIALSREVTAAYGR
jgi:DNA-binding NarL/FixJ family response regulator